MRTRTALAVLLPALALSGPALGQSQQWERDGLVLLRPRPEKPVVAVHLELEFPPIYTVVGTPVSPLADLVASPTPPDYVLSTTQAPDGTTRLLLHALFTEGPARLQPRLLLFTISASDPDLLPLPIRIRRFTATMEDGRRSKLAEVGIRVQSHPSGQYEPLP